VYVSGMLGTPTATAPKISWTPNTATKVLTITRGATDSTYSSGGTPNLIFRNTTDDYWVTGTATLSITNTLAVSTNNIDAGDMISGFGPGTYTIIWKPTNEILGTVSF